MKHNTELHSGIHSGTSAREPPQQQVTHILSLQPLCNNKSNKNKMDTGLREREHLLTLKGRCSL